MLHRVSTPLSADMGPQGRGHQHARIFDWLWKIIYILLCLDLGILLLCLPWRSFWDNNYLLYLYPQIRPLVVSPYFKGFVLGLGIVNILIGIHEVVHIKDLPKKNLFSR